MNCSFCAAAGWKAVPAARASAPAAIARVLFISPILLRKEGASIAPSMRERPQAQLLLANLPQPGQPVRLDDQEEDDQPAEDDQLQVGEGGVRELHPEDVRQPARGDVEEDREQRDE